MMHLQQFCRARALRVGAATVLIGIGSGLSGMLLSMLLHLLQHLAYGYSLDAIIGQQSFLYGVTEAAPSRRVGALVLGGAVAGLGGWALRALRRPVVSVDEAIAPGGRTMQASVLADAVLQIATVGLGSPLGREGAPRQAGGFLAARVCRWFSLDSGDARIFIACGAGAGLAAVYNVPLAGALFTLEVLLQTIRPRIVVLAVATSALAALVASFGLGDQPQYRLGLINVTPALICWSVLLGPAFGYAGAWYARLAAWARDHRMRRWHVLPACLLVFVLIGLASVFYPQLPGNGRGPIQLGLDDGLTPGLAATLLVLKLLATTACLAAGAGGGMLTPGLTIGALLGTVLGYAWAAVWPGTSLASFTIVGGTAFLASSMRMPLTAAILVLELTDAKDGVGLPILLATAGAMLARAR
jgi:H+/Cl- antiporter ClcA